MALAYPTAAEHLYALLTSLERDELRVRFEHWRFTARQVASLLALQPDARTEDFPAFDARLRVRLDGRPEDFPPVLRPRVRASDWEHRRSRYAALLKGKRVALVGPSRSIAGSNHGPAIESCDLVARVNFQWPVPSTLAADAGTRMDVLYHCCNADVPITELFQPGFERTRFVCWQFGIDSHALEARCAELGVPDVEVTAVFEHVLRRVNAFPTTGTVALFDVLSHEIAELYVTGFTFFRDPYHDGYRTGGDDLRDAYRRGRSRTIGIHDVDADLALVRQLRAADARLHVDDELARVLAVG